MDRRVPDRDPEVGVAGEQRWRDLLFLHWPVDAGAMQALLPDGLTLDTFEGVAHVGIVAFTMEDIRPWWLPRAMALDFLETNVRTYVHRDGADPGVYFLSLDASSWLAATAARVGWGLPYFHAEMSQRLEAGETRYALRRRTDDGPRLDARFTPGAVREAAGPGTLEHYLLERYLLYVERGGVLYRGQVEHEPYPVHDVTLHALSEQLVEAAGLPATTGDPIVHFSPGVDTQVLDLARR